MTTEHHPETETETETDGTDHTSPTKRVLAVCRDCGRPSTAKYIADGSMQVVGTVGCPNCGGTDLRELSAEEVVGGTADEDAEPEQETPSSG
ncbi:hypothetical protein [Halostagnicola bangensis]